MALNYTSYVTAISTLAVQQPADPSFVAILPDCIDFAEQRIYRELDLLSTNIVDTSTTLVSGVRTAKINTVFVATNNVSVLVPAGSTALTGSRVPLVPTSLDALNTLWPGSAITDTPETYAMLDQWTLVLGPCPDANYLIEVVGTQRPAPLSVTNPNTFLTDRLPDLFVAASMTFMGSYMRNADMAADWEGKYQALFKSASTEEERKKYWASSWSSLPNSANASAQRG